MNMAYIPDLDLQECIFLIRVRGMVRLRPRKCVGDAFAMLEGSWGPKRESFAKGGWILMLGFQGNLDNPWVIPA